MRVEAVCSFFLSFFSALALSSSVSVACASATPTLVAACLLMPAWLGLLGKQVSKPACLLAARDSVRNARFASKWTSFVYE